MAFAVCFGLFLGLFAKIPASQSAQFAARPLELGHETATRRLSDGDIARYRAIVTAQADRRWDIADLLIYRLEDRQLVGYLLADRYLGPDYQTGYPELLDWLAQYSELSPAAMIHALAMRKRPKSAYLPPAPPKPARFQMADEDGENENWSDVPAAAYDNNVKPAILALRRVVRAARYSGEIGAGLDAIADGEQSGEIPQGTLDELRGEIAATLFTHGRDGEALAIASVAARSDQAPNAAWIAGLAAWRMDRKALAGQLFERAARARATPLCQRAGAAYWAARAQTNLQRKDNARDWFIQAATAPQCFYGLLAQRRLGRDIQFDWQPPTLNSALQQSLARNARLQRVQALGEIGAYAHAEEELRLAIPQLTPEEMPLALILANRARLPSVALGVAGQIAHTQGVRWNIGLYPAPPWSPLTGFTIDRALLYAIMRVESRFQPQAVSNAGAIGLMQLMPETARTLGAETTRLADPVVNLGAGQRYLASLIGADPVGNDLLRLAVAYNGGPGTLAKWREQAHINHDDPLLFLESLPFGETRLFVERVMTYLWIYRSRFGQPLPSLDALANGEWPSYQSPNDAPIEVAERHARN